MNNNLIQIKIRERLNKLSSLDYDNIECWQIAEAFNKAQVEWVRRQLHGNNLFKEGDEQSTRRVDDLQVLLTSKDLTGVHRDVYIETHPLPEDYLQYKRVTTKGFTTTCKHRPFRVYLAEEADADQLLNDTTAAPDFEWGETFCTLIGNRIRIYTNNLFNLSDMRLIYYRFPRPMQIINCTDPETGNVFTKDQSPEFKDDIVELIIDDTCSILAGDIESQLQFQRNSQNAERNN
jgi:hypothetical protein